MTSANVSPTFTPWAMIDSEQVETTLGKRVGAASAGRPPKHVDASR